MTSLRPPIGAILALAALVACGKSEPGNGDGTGKPADWAQCDTNSDCVLASAGCCDACGEPTLDDVDAVNARRIDEHFADVCPSPTPCPLCPAARDPDLHATCSDDACVALDIRNHPASACSSDDECRLRVTGCCECGGSTASWDLIAINLQSEAKYRALVCDPDQGCAECAPVYPTDVETFCESDGHCAIRLASECEITCAQRGLTCCAGQCVLTYNDARNCGGCGSVCPEEASYCSGTCMAPPCEGIECGAAETCCGSECCLPGELCCTVPGPGPSGEPSCYPPNEAGTCPVGCPLCE